MQSEQAHNTGLGLEQIRTGPRSYRLELSGELGFKQSGELWESLRALLGRRRRPRQIRFDLEAVTRLDGSAAALLSYARTELRRRRVDAEFVNAHGPVQEIIELYDSDGPVGPRPKRRPVGLLDQLGRASARFAGEVRAFLGFVGELTVVVGRSVRHPRSVNLRDLGSLIERAGADAVPIVVFTGFLVGLVSAAQSAAQLERYGANLFVADLVGISMARELGPLMTAIIVTGRSGAAYAAEIGSMRVNEEVDALEVMGLSPMRFLVLPRIASLVLALPLLVLFCDAMGMLGGLVVGVTRLDLSASAYLSRIAEAVQPWDLGLGLGKSLLFAMAIGGISCQQGFAARGGAAAVGDRTTAAVVGSLFCLIIIDAAIAVLVGAIGR